MSDRFAPLAAAHLDSDAAALRQAIVDSRQGVADLIGLIRDDGSLRGPFDPLLRSPAVGDVVQRLGSVIRSGSTLSPAVCEIAILTVTDLHDCEFEKQAHTRIAASRGILAPEDVGAVSAAHPRFSSGDLATAWAASREQVRDGRLTPATLDAAVETFGERGVVELTVLIAYYQLVAALMHTCAPAPHVG